MSGHTAYALPIEAIACCFLLTDHDRYLRSFPTRRSSDLVRREVARERRGAFVDAVARELGLDLLVHFALHTHARRGGQRGADRKSTRLNSSHLVISIAFFFMNNKNEKNNDKTNLSN